MPAAPLAATASEDRGRGKREPGAHGGCSQRRRNPQTEAQRALAAALPKFAWRGPPRHPSYLVFRAAFLRTHVSRTLFPRCSASLKMKRPGKFHRAFLFSPCRGAHRLGRGVTCFSVNRPRDIRASTFLLWLRLRNDRWRYRFLLQRMFEHFV